MKRTITLVLALIAACSGGATFTGPRYHCKRVDLVVACSWIKPS
jgi:hypothetical protein